MKKNIIYILKNGFNNNIIENAIYWENKEMTFFFDRLEVWEKKYGLSQAGKQSVRSLLLPIGWFNAVMYKTMAKS